MRAKTIVITLLVLVLVGGSLAAAFYFYTQMKNLREEVSQQTTQDDVAAIVALVGDAMELPDNEDPTLATVVDRNALEDQPFFANAENGDKVLIYTNARKAILYRPETDKIIEVAPIYFAPEEADTALAEEDIIDADDAVTSTVRMSLYTAGAGEERVADITTLLQESFETLAFVSPPASTSTATGITVVDVSGNASQQAAEIATLLGGTIGPLPDGFSAVDTDIIVVLGVE